MGHIWKAFPLLFWFILVVKGQLKCQHGVIIRGTEPASSHTFTEEECPGGKDIRCARADVYLFHIGIASTSSSALCVNKSQCSNLCKRATAVYSQTTNGEDSSFAPTVKYCEEACCKIDNCNGKTVAEILAAVKGGGITWTSSNVPMIFFKSLAVVVLLHG